MLLQLVNTYLADPGFFGVPLPMRLGLAVMPTWLNHMTTNAVIDGDGVLLYGQARPSMRFLLLAVRAVWIHYTLGRSHPVVDRHAACSIPTERLQQMVAKCDALYLRTGQGK